LLQERLSAAIHACKALVPSGVLMPYRALLMSGYYIIQSVIGLRCSCSRCAVKAASRAGRYEFHSPAGFIFGVTKGGKTMSAVTHDVILKRKPRKKRRKGEAALRSLRRALARRQLEQMRDDEILNQQIYDVFEDDTTSKV